MPSGSTRRTLLLGLGAAALTGRGALALAAGDGPTSAEATTTATTTTTADPAAAGPVPASFPQQDPSLVAAVVGASHRDLDRVRELVSARPELAKASWDWGFGDWESALGAASHTGRREIAEYLLAHGARPTIFSAAMLGQLAVVRAFVEAHPGAQGIPGPHGIPLLAHAEAGGEPAAAVVAYLREVGGADVRVADLPLSDDEKKVYVGVYAWGAGAGERFEVFVHDRGWLGLKVGEGAARGLMNQGGDLFHPAGAPSVRIAFELREGRAVAARVVNGDLAVAARRV